MTIFISQVFTCTCEISHVIELLSICF